ncbi:hypothetical protein GobsT_31200 [Gemmata obscuriglobus]|uniref:Uncharacterized protein n=1 Tax=Gemmata obscuriglobus TaxID=114 RepID=A0A2Z3H1G8_9BACT|nr:hypothetical protein [Gemmata obscuriglobus]AWM38691.1 hypothetical protein C1280_17990 [Gemmata obscuriglobus]QEG28343.1 hypothetical protein GobsT_31200 [Gemmata obscuriglobus]VTS06223.1 hypothetical protein : [Gemmata obscuriglobus UQM 2246]
MSDYPPVTEETVETEEAECGCNEKFDKLGEIIELVTATWACPVCGSVTFEKGPGDHPPTVPYPWAGAIMRTVVTLAVIVTFAAIYLTAK